MRVTIWAIASLISMLAAVGFVLSNPPQVGGGSMPYDTYTPPGGNLLLWGGLSLVVLGITLVIARVPKKLWFIYVFASVLPLLWSIRPAYYDFWNAHDDSMHPWIGSDVAGHIAAGIMSLMIGLIFTAMLINVSVAGYRRRRRSKETNQASQQIA